jgi:N-acetylglutamate synthase-like GNAT family acetyltransferase
VIDTMPGQLSSGERELASLVAQLRALEEDIGAARATAERAGSTRGLEVHLHREPAPALHGERVRLADGAEIVVRPIEPHDLHELAVGFGRLGALSRFRRFRERVDRLTQQQLLELTQIDNESHEAFVALDAATGEGVGVARYARVPDDPARAEVACTVLDPWQHRGVGSVLAERLAARARANGIERCTALILLGNEPARRLLAHVTDEIREERDGGTLAITAEARRAP